MGLVRKSISGDNLSLDLVPGVFLPVSPPPLSFMRFSGNDLSEAVGDNISISLKFSLGPFSKPHLPNGAEDTFGKNASSSKEGAFRSSVSFSDPYEVSSFLRGVVEVYFDSLEPSTSLAPFSEKSLSSWKRVFEKFIPPVFPKEGESSEAYIGATLTTFPLFSNFSFFKLSYEEALEFLSLKNFSSEELIDAFWYVFVSTADNLSSRVSSVYDYSLYSLPFIFKKNSSGRIVSVVIPFLYPSKYLSSPDTFSSVGKYLTSRDFSRLIASGDHGEAIFSTFNLRAKWLVFASVSYDDFSSAVLRSLKDPVFFLSGSRKGSNEFKGFVVDDYYLVIDGIKVRIDSVVFDIKADAVFRDKDIPASLPGFRISNNFSRSFSSGFVMYKKSFERDYGKIRFALIKDEGSSRADDRSGKSGLYMISSYTAPRDEQYEKYRLSSKEKTNNGIKRWFDFIFRPKDPQGSFLTSLSRKFGNDVTKSPFYTVFSYVEDDQQVLNLANVFWGGYGDSDPISPPPAVPEPVLRILTLSSLGFLTVEQFNRAYSLLASLCLTDSKKRRQLSKKTQKKRGFFEKEHEGYLVAKRNFCNRIFGSSHVYWLASLLPEDFLSSLFPDLPWTERGLLDLCFFGKSLSYRSLLFYENDLQGILSSEDLGSLPEDDKQRLRLSLSLSDIASTISGLNFYMHLVRMMIERFGTFLVRLDVVDNYEQGDGVFEAHYYADMFLGMGSGKVFLVTSEVGPGGRILHSDLLLAPLAPSSPLALLVYQDQDQDVFYKVDLGVTWVNALAYFWENKLDV